MAQTQRRPHAPRSYQGIGGLMQGDNGAATRDWTRGMTHRRLFETRVRWWPAGSAAARHLPTIQCRARLPSQSCEAQACPVPSHPERGQSATDPGQNRGQKSVPDTFLTVVFLPIPAWWRRLCLARIPMQYRTGDARCYTIPCTCTRRFRG